MSKRGSCFACAFWELTERNGEFQDEGICRFNAPTAIPSRKIGADGEDQMGRYGFIAAWPRTFAETDWCGQFREAEIHAGRNTEDKEP